MASRSALINIDLQQALRAADLLGKIEGRALGQVGIDAINQVLPVYERRAREAIVAGVNLGDPYVRPKMGVRPADNPARPEGSVYALASSRGDRRTPLGRYDPKQLTTAAKRPARAKGDKSRGIAAGRKAAGVSVQVIRGAAKPMPGAFLMPLRNGNGVGVFTRSRGDLRYQHRLGPSVYQLFRVQADLLAEESAVDLQLAVLNEAERVMEAFE